MLKRIQQINQLLKRELSQIILKEIEFPLGVLVTITRAEASANLFKSRIFISVIPEEKSSEIFKILNSRIYNLQQKINKRFRMRPVPQIIFMEEKKTKEAGRIEELLEKLKKEKD